MNQPSRESKWRQFKHLDEAMAAITISLVKPLRSNMQNVYSRNAFDPIGLAFCDDILGNVSQSFAVVIRQLPPILLVDVMVFYLVLRALDTIEDDTAAFDNGDVKIQHLLSFSKQALRDPSWCMHNVGTGHERKLLEDFPKCHRIYAALSPTARRIIADSTDRMATGMAEFVGKDLGQQGTSDVPEYNRYCYIVAGIVGEGLSRLFAASGLEQASFAGEMHLSGQMGLFLHKAHVIRDFLEDYDDKRAWWPQSVWKKYSESGSLGYFVNQSDATVRRKSRHCLNEMVTDALELVPDCLMYMSKLHSLETFRFCAIPQAMAIATLDYCYANETEVFTGVVKIRRGLKCKLISHANNLAEVHGTFYHFAQSILKRANYDHKQGIEDPSYMRTVKACDAIMHLTASDAMKRHRSRSLPWVLRSAFVFVAVVLCFYGHASMNMPL